LTGDPRTQVVENVAVRPVPIAVGLLALWWGIRWSAPPGLPEPGQPEEGATGHR